MIDYPKTSGGIGAFLTPAMNGHGAQVERLAHGEMAEAVSLTNQFLPRAHSKSARARIHGFSRSWPRRHLWAHLSVC